MKEFYDWYLSNVMLIYEWLKYVRIDKSSDGKSFFWLEYVESYRPYCWTRGLCVMT